MIRRRNSSAWWVLARSRRRRAGGAFVPTAIDGAVLWLRADLGVTLNGSNVSAWADQSGSGNHFAQATAASQPAFGAAVVGDQPGLVFTDGDNDSVVFGGAKSVFNRLHNGTECTTFHVIDVRAALQGYFFDTLRVLATRIGFELGVFAAGPANLRVLIGNGTAATFDASLAMGTGKHVIVTRGDGTGIEVRVDGAVPTGGSGNWLATPSVADSFGALTLGDQTLGGDSPSIDYAETAVYGRRLTDAEVAKLEIYATSRYGL